VQIIKYSFKGVIPVIVFETVSEKGSRQNKKSKPKKGESVAAFRRKSRCC
jgi:hypothetical protein